MNYSTKLNLEVLESRLVASAVDVAVFQQQVPQLQAELNATVPVLQANLQQFLNEVEKESQQLLTLIQQQQLAPVFSEAQWIVTNFPVLAQQWFNRQVQLEEATLLSLNDTTVNNSSPSYSQTYYSSPSHTTYYTTTYTTTYTYSYSSRFSSQPAGLYSTTGSLTL